MASYGYSALEVLVTANTRQMSAAIEKDAVAAGQKAGSQASEHIGKGFGRLVPIAGQIGKAAATGLGLATAAAVTFGIKAYKAAEEANVAIAQTNAVIKSTGGAANVTAGQVGRLASSLMVQAGISRGVTRAGENMLLTFRNVRNEQGRGNQIFDRATRSLADMTAALNGGQVTSEGMRSGAIRLGRALNDPVKGVTALSRVGVQFTTQQQAQIKTLVASGHTLQAQKIILNELNKEFGGSAASAATAGKRFHAAFGAIQVGIGQMVMQAVDPAVTSFVKLVSRVAEMTSKGGKLAPIFNAVADALKTTIAPLTHVIDLFTGWLGKLTPKQVNEIADAIKRFGPALAAAGAGAALFTGAGLGKDLPVIGPMLSNLLGPLGKVKEGMISVGRAAAVQMFPSLSGKVGEVEGLGKSLGSMAAPLTIAVAGFALLMAVSPPFRKAVMDIGRALLSALAPVLVSITASFKELLPPIVEVAKILGGALSVALEAVVPLITVLGDVLKLLAPVLPLIVEGFLAYKVAMTVAAAAQWLFNAAVEANPLGLLVIALVAVGAALVYAWQHSATFRKIVVGTWHAILAAAMAVWDWLKANWPTLVAVLTGPFGIAALLIIKHWQQIRSFTVATWNFLRRFVSSILASITGVIRSAMNVIGRVVTSAMTTFRRVFSSGFNAVRTTVANGARTILRTVQNLAGGFLTAGKNAIHNLLSGISNAMHGISGWIKGNVVDPIVNAVKHFFGIHSPSTVMADIGGNLAKGLFKGMVPGMSGVGNLVHQVFGSFPAALGGMIEHGLIGVASLPGKALNALMGLFGGGDAGSLAMTARKYLGHRYVWGGGANSATGFDCSSFVNMLSGMLGLSIPGGFHAPSAGHGPTTLGWLANAMQHVGYGGMRPNDLYVSPEHMGVVTGMNTGFAARSTDTGTGPQTIGPGYDILRFAGGKHLPSWLDGLMGKLSGIFGKLFGGGPSGGESGSFGGATRWSGLMRQVLAGAGRPDLFAPFMRQMETESNGNPDAINRWDINWLEGHPSQGLMQVIPGTFAAYAGPYRRMGILSPLANIYAAVHYALDRYRGNVAAVIGHGHGYAAGGIINEPITGIGHRSRELYQFGERGPELVSPLTGPSAMVPGHGGRAITINVYPQQGQSETAIAAAVSRRLDWAVSTGRA